MHALHAPAVHSLIYNISYFPPFRILLLLLLLRSDLNTSLTAIGLIWNINEHTQTDVMSELLLLNEDERGEVRNSSVNTLFSIINSGKKMKDYRVVFTQTIFKMLDGFFSKVKEEQVENDEHATAATHNADGRRGFKMVTHHSRDNVKKQLTTTMNIAMKGVQQVIRQVSNKTASSHIITSKQQHFIN